MADQLGFVQFPARPEGSWKGSTTLGQAQAFRMGMQPRSPAGDPLPQIRDQDPGYDGDTE